MTTAESANRNDKTWVVPQAIFPYCKWACERRAKRFSGEAMRQTIGDDFILKQSYPNLFARFYMGLWVLFSAAVFVSLLAYFAKKRWAPSLMIYSSIPMVVCMIEPLFYLSTPLGRFFILTDGIGVAALLLMGIRLRRELEKS